MTSFAFILGVSPLVIASGAGAGSRHSLGTGVFAGMLFATTIGIFFIPLFFRVIRGLAEGGAPRRPAGAARAAADAGVAGGPMIRRIRRCLLAGLARGRLRRRAQLPSRGSRARLDPGRRGPRRATARAHSSTRSRRPGRTTPWPPAGALLAPRAAPARLARQPRVARHLPRLDDGRAGPDRAALRIAIFRRRSAGSASSGPRWASRRRRSFRRARDLVDPAELLQLLAGLAEHAEHLAVERQLVDAAGIGVGAVEHLVRAAA